tara:strand:+ start:207 stop:401 length:195 start_codon:yes stop_codon:yes gene_type:complete
MKKLNKLAKEMFAEFGFWTCSTAEQEEIVKVVKNELLWIIEEFELGGVTSFDCIQQIKEKVKEL